MNIYQYDPTHAYFGARSERNQRLMTLVVRAGIPLSLLMIAAAGAFLCRTPSQVRRPHGAPEGTRWPVLIVLAFSVAFFVNIAALLPFVRFAYCYGYGLARLVMPAILGFCFLGFVLLDERLRSGTARGLVLAFAAAQATLHASFLWPRGP